MSEQAEILEYLGSACDDSDCGLAECGPENVFMEDGVWKMKLCGFMSAWELGATVDQAKRTIDELSSQGFGLS